MTEHKWTANPQAWRTLGPCSPPVRLERTERSLEMPPADLR